MALLAGLAIVSCSKDDDGGGNCVSCDFEGHAQDVCKGDNGNAFMNGVDSQINFDEFVDTFCTE